MNGERYVGILQDKVLPHFSREAGERWIFQQEWAAPHYSLAARQFLDNHLNGRWVGRRGPIKWPACSPDLTPCDFWFWSHLRDQVYPTPGNIHPNLQELHQRIDQEIQNINLIFFRKSMCDFVDCFRKTRYNSGRWTHWGLIIIVR